MNLERVIGLALAALVVVAVVIFILSAAGKA